MKQNEIRSIAIALVLSLHLSVAAVFAQDVKGSKDHPLLSRYPNSRISSYEKNYNEVDFAKAKDEQGNEVRETLEGDVTQMTYFHKDAETQPSALQLIRNYQEAVKSIGGEVLYERKPAGSDGGEATLRVSMDGKEFWIKVTPGIFSAPTQSYDLVVLERKAMEQLVTANKLLDELNSKGYVTLYINFDTNKWDIKPEALPTLAEVAKMLNNSPTTKIAVEGHTDNVGTPDANKSLSSNRATSVLEAIVSKGVDRARLSAEGLGQERPIADNRSEDGRAKNRRVELVKK